MPRALVSTVAVLLLTAPPAIAQTYTLYDCTFVIRGQKGQQSRFFYALDAQGGAFTYDRKSDTDAPFRVPVSVRKLGNGDLVFAYAFDQRNVDNQTARVTAQTRVPAAGGKSRISFRAKGFQGGSEGTGTCKLERNVRLP